MLFDILGVILVILAMVLGFVLYGFVMIWISFKVYKRKMRNQNSNRGDKNF